MNMVNLEEMVLTFHENVRVRLEELSKERKETQALLLGREGLDKGRLWAIKGRRGDPRLSTLIKLARSVGAYTPEEFGELFCK